MQKLSTNNVFDGNDFVLTGGLASSDCLICVPPPDLSCKCADAKANGATKNTDRVIINATGIIVFFFMEYLPPVKR